MADNKDKKDEPKAGKYRLKGKAYMPPAPGERHKRLEAGTEVEYAGIPGRNLIPLDATAKKAVEDAKEAKEAKGGSLA